MEKIVSRYGVWLPALALVSSPLLQGVTHTNQTAFIPRSLAYDVVQEYALSYNRVFHAHHKREYEKPVKKSAFDFQASGMYQESCNRDDLARYFLLDGKTELVVDQQGNGDIGSGWLGLFAGGDEQNFHGSFSIAPKRTVLGVTLQTHADLSSWIDGVWFQAVLPIVHVSHDLGFKEEIMSGTLDAGSFSSIAAALNNPAWRYGKISDKRLSRSGCDDVAFKLGWGMIRYEKVRVDAHVHFLAPLGDRPRAEFLFEPLVGMGGHFGCGGGASVECEIFRTSRQRLRLLTHLSYRHLCAATEKRSFDIKGRPWSRYMIYNTQGSNLVSALPGINFFTFDTRVLPGGRFDLFTSLSYNYAWVNVECGYRYFWKNGDKVRFDKAWPYEIDISAQADDTFLSNALISNPWGLPLPGQGSFVKIRQDDLDLSSAQHKTTQTSTVYGAVSLQEDLYDHPAMVGFGGSYEMTNRNSGFDQWSIWISMSLGF